MPVLSEADAASGWNGRTGFVHQAVMQDVSAMQSYLIQHAESPRAALAECEDWLAELGALNRDFVETV